MTKHEYQILIFVKYETNLREPKQNLADQGLVGVSNPVVIVPTTHFHDHQCGQAGRHSRDPKKN